MLSLSVFRSRRSALVSKILLGCLALLVHTAVAFGADLNPFDEAAFKKAQAEGKTIVLDFHAVWCGICKKQQPALKSVLGDAQFKDFVAYAVDYDWAVDLIQEYNVTNQATIVVLKGETEKGRATGITEPADIKTLLLKGV